MNIIEDFDQSFGEQNRKSTRLW